MAIETSTGPYLITGNTNPQQFVETDFGPSLTAAGDGIPDPRKVFANVGDAPSLSYQSKVYGITNHVYACVVDAVPQAASNTRIAAAQAATVPAGGSVALTLVTAQGAGVSPNIPVLPFGRSLVAGNTVPCLALDFGYTTGNTTAGLKTITIPVGAYRYFSKGQPILVSGAGASANTPLFTTVVSVSGTTLTVADAAGQTVSGAQIGNAFPSFGPQVGVAVPAAWPFRPGSPYASSQISMFDPTQGIARAVSITTGSAGNAGFTAQVVGYDIDGVPMTEVITVPGTATTQNGRKAFKYISAVNLLKAGGGALTGTIAVGTTDIFGFNLRSDFWEYLNIYWAGSFQTTNTPWTAADVTTPATSTTGDVRGTFNAGSVSASDGTKRLAMFMSMPQYNLLNATNLDSTSLYGVTQA
jgi:hypothetical protein